MEAHGKRDNLLLTDDELQGLFEAAARIEDPELIPDLVMGGHHIRKRSEISEDALERQLALSHDSMWRMLSERGTPEPIEDDPRRAEDPMEWIGYLRPEFLFMTREAYLEKARAEDAIEQQELLERTLGAYEKISDALGKDAADSLLLLVGGQIDDQGKIGFNNVPEERLVQVREIVMVISPSMRDIVRMNHGLWRLIEPAIASYVQSGDFETEGLELAQFKELRTNVHALLSEHVDLIDFDQ